MIRKKFKGFTLVELLAVIVILGIIALIAVPITMNVIEDSKKASVKVGTTHYIDTLEDELQYDLINEDEITSGMYLIKNNGMIDINGQEKKLPIKGSLPNNGVICVNEDGLVESYSVILDGYVVTNTNGEQKIETGTTPKSLTCNVSEETVEIIIPENVSVCSQDKIVEIKYPEYEEVAKEYSFDRENWKEYTGVLTLDKNTSLYARLRDKRNNKISGIATMVFTTIDNTKVTTTSPSVALSTEKPTSQIEVTFRQTDNCGVDKNTIKYGISTTKDGTYTWQDDAVFKKLNNNTTYYIKTKVNDEANNGIVESEISEITTGKIETVNIVVTPESWSTSKKVTISGKTTGADLQYQLNGTDGKWENIQDGYTFETEENIVIYARLWDGTTAGETKTYTITTIDRSEPRLILGTAYSSTNSITIPISMNEDPESGIKSTTCKYGTAEGSYTVTGTINGDTCVFNKLKNNRLYYYQVTTTNKAGVSTSVDGTARTGDFGTIEIVQNTSEWTTSKNIKITGVTSGSRLQYQLNGHDDDKWIDISSGTTINLTENATVYARLWDGTNESSVANLTVTTIDTTAPEIVLGPPTVTTNSITIPINTNKDDESGIKETVCKYGTSEGSYTSTGIISGGKCTISNIKNGTTYYYQVTTTNKAGISSSAKASTKTGEFAGITITTSSTGWTTSKIVTIKGTTAGSTLQYKVVSGSTVKKDWTAYSSPITINWAANTTTPTYVYARFSDGTNYSNQETLTITTIDITAAGTTAPSLAASTTNPTKAVILTNKQTDSESGIDSVQYGYSTSEAGTYTWQDSDTISGLTQGETYYFKTRVKNGAGTGWTESVAIKNVIPSMSSCNVSMNTTNWAQSKTATITGSQTGVSLQYRVVSGTTEKVGWTTISSGKTQTINWAANTTTPTYVYCRMTDGTTTVDGTTYTETKVDVTAASTTVPTVAESATNPTKAAVVTFKQTDSESGISSKQYGYSTSENGTYTWQDSDTISGLTQGGTYYFKTRAKNGAGIGWTETAAVPYSPTKIATCLVSMNTTNWATSKTATITGSQTGVTLQYRVVSGTTEKVGWTTISSGKTQTINWAANTTTPTYIYCRMTDGTTTVNGTTYTETKVDVTAASTTAPTSVASTTNPTKAAVVTNKQTDSESGISSIQYGYSTSEAGTYTWGTSSTISGLTQGGTYYLKTRVKNGAGTGWTESLAVTHVVPSMTPCSVSMSNAGVWKPSKTATITGSQTGVSLQYRVVSGTTEKVGWTTISSGKTQTINWVATTATPTYVYCRMTDGTSTINGTTYTETTTDPSPATTTAPTVTASTTNPTKAAVITLKQADGESGISSIEYGYSTSEAGTYTWGTSSTISGLTQGGTYYFKTRVKNGAGTGWTESTAVLYSPTKITNCSISMNTTNWATSKTATITGSQTGVTLQYRVVSGTTEKVAWTTISSGKTQAIDWEANTTTPTYVYCRMTDGTTTVNGTTYTETKIDRTAPSTPTTMSFVYGDWSTYGGGWTNQTIYAARVSGSPGPTGSTDSESGVAKYQISSDGSTWVDYVYNTSSSMYVFSTTGTHTRYFRAVDAAGNVSGAKSVTAYIDKTAPPTPSSELRYGSSTGTLRGTASTWTNQNLWWGKFSSTDTGGSGTSYYQYSTSCTGTVNGTLSSSYTYSSNANSYYCIRAVDAAGNASAWSGAYYIRIDKTAPGTASSTIRINNSSGTVRANTTAWTNQTLWWGSFTATDNVGVSYYQYSTGCTGTASNNLSASYTYSSTTNYTFCIRAVDAAGNAGAWSGAYYIKVDKTAPSCGTWSGGGTSWTTSNRSFSITCSDSHSQCTSSSFSTAYSSSAKTGNVTITIKDNAGNTANCTASKNIYVDKTKPTATMSPAAGKYTSGTMSVVLTCSDSHSGMKQAWLSDAGYVTTGTSTTSQSLASIKERTATGKCTDNVGNVSEVNTKYNIVGSGSGGKNCTTYYGQTAQTCNANGWTQVSCSSGSNCTCQKC